MPTLLFEIGCEELPANAVREAGEQLPALAREHLGVEPAELFLGPRRLAILVRDLPAQTEEHWVQGPPVKVGEKAAEGFARKQGVAAEQQCSPTCAPVARKDSMRRVRPAACAGVGRLMPSSGSSTNSSTGWPQRPRRATCQAPRRAR